MVEVATFYPFGLQIDELSGSFKQPKFGYLFNGIERVEDFGLNIETAEFRSLDVTTGRWWQVD